MIPGKYDITIYRGSTWTITISAENAAEVATNFNTAYIDNPSADSGTIRMQIRPIYETGAIPVGTALLELTIANSRIAVAEDGLTLTLTIDAATTAALKFNEGKYELELVTGATVPVVDKLIYGDVVVTGEITI